MVDATFIGGLNGLKAAIDITKALVDVRDAAKLAAVRVELLGHLIETQEAQLALIAEKRELAERVRQLEDWDREAEGYELADIGNGCLAYVKKSDGNGIETPHSLCPNCYHQRRKSFLVPYAIDVGRAQAMQCHACKTEMIIRGVDGREMAKIAARRPQRKLSSPRF